MKILRRKSSFRNLLTVLLAMFSFAAVLSGCSRLDSASDGLETTAWALPGQNPIRLQAVLMIIRWKQKLLMLSMIRFWRLRTADFSGGSDNS